MKKLVVPILLITLVACSRPAEQAETKTVPTDGLIQMEAEAQGHVGLAVTPAATVSLTEFLQVTGTVQPIDSRVGHVRPLGRGRLRDIGARVGDRVARDQVLARMDNLEAEELATQLASARADLRRLEVQRAAQAKQTERSLRLSDIGASPRKDYEQSLAEEQALQESIRSQESAIGGVVARLSRLGLSSDGVAAGDFTMLVRAPFLGVITSATASPGAVVDSEHDLFTVTDLSRVWVQAEVYEKDLGRIRLGQSAVVHVDTYPDQPFRGTVTYISDILDPQTRTARVRCEMANEDVRLKLDMFATVELPTNFQRRTVAVPEGAVQQLEGKNVVFVQKEQTAFEPREVQIGKTVNGTTEIVTGLRDGEPIVTQGAFHLKAIVAGKKLGDE